MRWRQFEVPCKDPQWVVNDPKARDERMQVQEDSSGGGRKPTVHTQGTLGTSMRRPHPNSLPIPCQGQTFLLQLQVSRCRQPEVPVSASECCVRLHYRKQYCLHDPCHRQILGNLSLPAVGRALHSLVLDGLILKPVSEGSDGTSS